MPEVITSGKFIKFVSNKTEVVYLGIKRSYANGESIEQKIVTLALANEPFYLKTNGLPLGTYQLQLVDNQSRVIAISPDIVITEQLTPAVVDKVVKADTTTIHYTLKTGEFDAVNGSEPSNWSINEAITIKAITLSNDHKTAIITTHEPIQSNQSYRIAPQQIAMVSGFMAPPSALFNSEQGSVVAVYTNSSAEWYKTGQVITIAVLFDRNVQVNSFAGAPSLQLQIGANKREIPYVFQSGNTIMFSYEVQPGDSTSALDYVDTQSLKLNGSTIIDDSGIDVDLTLALPGMSGSISSSEEIIIN